MEHQKKKRGENWSSEEKDILRHLIAESAQIIEDKSTKTSINLQKIKEWKNISVKFNELTGKNRSDAELKLAWKRMKLSAKCNISTHRKQLLKTGGGAKPPSPSPQDLEIMDIAPHDFVIEVNDFDSDAVNPVTTITEDDADPKPGPSSETITNVENPENITGEAQGISNETVAANATERKTATMNNETTTKNAAKKRKIRLQHRSDDLRQEIAQTNADFKKRHLEMMETEHKYNIKIAELTIKKLELEVALLENKQKKTSTEG